ncbi:hypothetical protein HXX76_010962 [Chlamydomonas incerta]|uniref:Nephrocystin 3-like N-terminal domain-containing protein n=1 Tax=Chlamydomonas incerta TaxID=51695 RepID=A0A835VRU5_CHLIN|nr:hypothetical protein HXX76_010962 [Chlamydomonas incerta]|eukprot:KAG2423194.1 hypothetical protein HXX76_010962 [Chlamydomonas incerta]
MGGICSTGRSTQVSPVPVSDGGKLSLAAPGAALPAPIGPPPKLAPLKAKLAPLETIGSSGSTTSALAQKLLQSPTGTISKPSTPTAVHRRLRSAFDDDDLPPLPAKLATVGKGVSLRGLRKVRDAIRAHFGPERYASVSTAEVCQRWVKPLTARHGRCRLVEVPGLLDVGGGEVGRPLYFLSHAWSNSIELLFSKVFEFLSSASDDDTRVWLDVLAVCQHEDRQPEHRNDIGAFPDVVKACSSGTLVIMDLSRCNPASRAWCVFEWAHTLAAHGPDGLHMALAPPERAAVFRDLDVEAANCFRPEDKDMIMREVRKQHGSAAAFNAKLKLQLLLEPLSYSVDLRRLQERSRDTAWDFAAVERWLADGAAEAAVAASASTPTGGGGGGGVTWGGGYGAGGAAAAAGGGGGGGGGAKAARTSRAMCIVSGAGEGKSTISAEFVRRYEQPTHSPGGGGSTGGGGGGHRPASDSGGPRVAVAHHFLKYNDQRRLEPVRIIKSLAFQLASRMPAVCACLLEADVAAVAQLNDAARAFELLLLRPLQLAVGGAGRDVEPVVIVLDALDEADPVVPFSAALAAGGGAGGGASTVLDGTGVGAGAASGGRCPVLVGNRALQLLTTQLQRLPGCVRFFVTTRPDAASGQVVAALERTFAGQGGAAFLQPAQLVRAVAQAAPAAAAPSLAPGAAAAVASASAAAGTPPQASGGSGTGGGGGGAEGGNGGGAGTGVGVMVYHTVVRACLDPDDEEVTAGGAGAAPRLSLADGEGSGSTPATPNYSSAGGSSTAAATAAGRGLPPPHPPPPGAAAGGKSRRGMSLFAYLSSQAGAGPSVTAGSGGGGAHGASGSSAHGSGGGGSGTAGQGGGTADLAALYRVYGKVFRKAYEQYDDGVRQDVGRLLDVLMAAQEPLPHSLVQQLGLGGAVPRLPGFRTLFYVDEHHLFTLHKSLADWLLLDAVGVGTEGTGSRPGSRQSSARAGGAGGQSMVAAGGGGGGGASGFFARLQGRRTSARSSPLGNGGGGGGGGDAAHRVGGAGTGAGAGGHASRAAMQSEALAVAAQEAAAAAAASAPGPSFAIDVSQGHLLLARHLAAARASSPSPYCLKYLVTHAAAAGPAASALLDEVLGSFGFVEAVFAGGYGPNLIRALGAMPPGAATRLSRDALRWLRARQHDIAAAPAAATVLRTACMSPTASELYRLAVAAGGGGGWRTALAVPPQEVWPADMAVLKGHTGNVTAVLFGLDGRQLVSACGGGAELRVWDISSGTCTAVLQGHTGDVTCLALSHDGKMLASGANDMTCRLWMAATGQCTAVLRGHTGGVTGVAFSPPERGSPPRLVTSSSDNTLRIWSALPSASGTASAATSPLPSAPQPQPAQPAAAAAAKPSHGLSRLRPGAGKPGAGSAYGGSGAASMPASALRGGGGGGGLSLHTSEALLGIMGSSGSVAGWGSDAVLQRGGGGNGAFGLEEQEDAATGHQLHACLAVLAGKDGSGAQCIAWCPGGKRLAGGHGAAVCVWSVPTGKVAATLAGHGANVLGVAWCGADGGRRLASCGWDNTVKIWDTRNNKCLATLSGHAELVRTISWSPDGRRLASASSDCTLRIWDTTPTAAGGNSMGPAAAGLGLGGAAAAAAAAAAAGAGAGGVRCAAVVRGTEWVTAVAFSPDGRSIAAGNVGKELRLLDVAACEAEHAAATAPPVAAAAGAAGAAGGQLLLHSTSLARRGGNTRLAHLAHPAVTHTSAAADFSDDGSSAPASPSGAAAAAAAAASAAAFTNTAAHAHTADVTCLAMSPDGRLIASASEDRTVRLYDSATLRWRATLEGHGGCVTCVAWAPPSDTDGSQLQLASCSHDLSVRVWQIDTELVGGGGGGSEAPLKARCVAELNGHTDRIRSVAWSPAGGGALASGAEDNHVRLWDTRVAGGASVATLWGHGNYVTCVAYCPPTGGAARSSKSKSRGSGSGSGAGGGGGGQQHHELLASGSQDNTVRLWDTASHRCVRVLSGHDHYVAALAFSRCGAFLASASLDQSLRLWDTSPEANARAAAAMEAGTGGGGGGTSPGALAVLRGHCHFVNSVAWAPQELEEEGGGGAMVLATASTDEGVRVWEVEAGGQKGQCTAELWGHAGPVYCVAWVPPPPAAATLRAKGKAGAALVSGAADNVIRLWRRQK